MTKPIAATALLALGLLCLGCDVVDDENDIWITNGSDEDLERLTLDGQDRGHIDRRETRKLDDVPDGVHDLAAYRRAGDTEPCDTYETNYLSGDEDAYWVIDEDCN